ncbi:ABC transporter substrate-binding protein [Conexibacter woesei]|uniref:ABC transporter substrate-binding protein n=1 Tax=Conexibacter woesei TaxID=191495 RepID=UPI00030DFD92|nr:ABC transporter substrate-binding protein [Conexibacter woesei]
MNPHAIDRRDFLRAGAVLAAGAAGAAALGAAGCGGRGAGASGAVAISSDALGPRGGTARLLLGGGGPRLVLDPATQVNEPDAIVDGLLYDGLVRLHDDWRVEPRLATRWESDAAQRVWRFELRDGVTFHDGRPLTAKDVVYSLRRLLDERLGSAVYPRLNGELRPDGVRAAGSGAVELRLTQPDAFLPVALGARHCKIVPAGTTDFSRAIGTGPFRLRSLDQSKLSFELERNPGFWQEGLPRLDRIEGMLANDQASLVQSVASGRFHFGGFIDPSLASSAEASGDARLLAHRSALFNDLVAAADSEPFTNPDVRTALKLAIDREQILSLAYKGHGSIAHDVPVRTADPFFAEGLAHRTRDVDEARRLLRRAGYPNGIDLELLTAPAGAAMVDMAVVAKESLAEAGIRVSVQQRPAGTYYDAVWLKEAFYVDTWVLRHPLDAMAVMFESSAPWNEARLRSPRLDELLREARSTGERSEQAQLLGAAQTLVADQAGFVCPAWLDELYVAKPELAGVGFNATDLVDFQRASLG